MRIAFRSFQYLIKSVIYYGLDIEKVMALFCLEKCCLLNDIIRHEVLCDNILVEYLQSLLKQEESAMPTMDNLKLRLINRLNILLNVLNGKNFLLGVAV